MLDEGTLAAGISNPHIHTQAVLNATLTAASDVSSNSISLFLGCRCLHIVLCGGYQEDRELQLVQVGQVGLHFQDHGPGVLTACSHMFFSLSRAVLC